MADSTLLDPGQNDMGNLYSFEIKPIYREDENPPTSVVYPSTVDQDWFMPDTSVNMRIHWHTAPSAAPIALPIDQCPSIYLSDPRESSICEQYLDLMIDEGSKFPTNSGELVGRNFTYFNSIPDVPSFTWESLPQDPITNASIVYHPKVGKESMRNASTARRKKVARYKCSVAGCAATFTAKHNLDYHMNSHSGRRPYSCLQGCGFKAHARPTAMKHSKACKYGSSIS